MHQIDPENVEKFDVFVVFDAISSQFPREIDMSNNIIKNERTSYAVRFFKKTLLPFAAKHFTMTPNESKSTKNSKTFTFVWNCCVFFESLWIQNVDKRSTTTIQLKTQ